MRGVFLDFEASDKDVKTARITQMAFSIYNLVSKKELYHYSCLVNPGEFEYNATAEKITGITKEQLTEFGITTLDALAELISRFDGVEFLIAHNLHNYDLPLMLAEIERCAIVGVSLPKLIDTRFDIPWPDHIETRKLTYLGAEHGIVNPSAHAARFDVDLMAKLFFMYDLTTIKWRAQSPNIWVRAHVTFDDKDKAKERKFSWDAKNKIWVKLFKEMDYEHEKDSFNFNTSVMPEAYKGP